MEDFNWEHELDKCRRETEPLGPRTNKHRSTPTLVQDEFLDWPWQPARLFPENCDLFKLKASYQSRSPSPTVSENTGGTREHHFSLNSTDETEPRHSTKEYVPLAHWGENESAEAPSQIKSLSLRKKSKPCGLETKMDRLRELRFQLEDFKFERTYPGGVRDHADLGLRILDLEEIEKVLEMQARKEYYQKRVKRRLRIKKKKRKKQLLERHRLYLQVADDVDDAVVADPRLVPETVGLPTGGFLVPDENLQVIHEFEEPFPDEYTTSHDFSSPENTTVDWSPDQPAHCDIPTEGVDPIFLAALSGGATSGDEVLQTLDDGSSLPLGAPVGEISQALQSGKGSNNARELAEGIEHSLKDQDRSEFIQVPSFTE